VTTSTCSSDRALYQARAPDFEHVRRDLRTGRLQRIRVGQWRSLASAPPPVKPSHATDVGAWPSRKCHRGERIRSAGTPPCQLVMMLLAASRHVSLTVVAAARSPIAARCRRVPPSGQSQCTKGCAEPPAPTARLLRDSPYNSNKRNHTCYAGLSSTRFHATGDYRDRHA
jgi:hypothetical protein